MEIHEGYCANVDLWDIKSANHKITGSIGNCIEEMFSYIPSSHGQKVLIRHLQDIAIANEHSGNLYDKEIES